MYRFLYSLTYFLIINFCQIQLISLYKLLFFTKANLVKGYNGTVLAYGQTGSGKTYSMGSAHCVSEVGITHTTTGIIPRVVHDIFKRIEEKKNFDFVVKVSYVEVYDINYLNAYQ